MTGKMNKLTSPPAKKTVILMARMKRPKNRVTWLCYPPDGFAMVNLATGEKASLLESLDNPAVLRNARIVFPDMREALPQIAFKLAERGAVRIYGDLMAAAWWQWQAKNGITFCGLQGYGLDLYSLNTMSDLWQLLTAVCDGAHIEIQNTPGSTAFEIAKALAPAMFHSPGWRLSDWTNYGYSAGARHSKPGKCNSAWLYDIHAAYPEAMTQTLPFGHWRIDSKEDGFRIIRAKIDYTSDLEFSPLWVRSVETNDDGSRVFHPTDARGVTVVLNSIDLETLQQHGKLKIIKVYESMHFTESDDLRQAVNYFVDWQAKAPTYRKALKVMVNSVYGKFCQRGEMTQYVLKPITDPKEARRDGNLDHVFAEATDWKFGLFGYPSNAPTFANVPVAGAITAKVRQKVYSYVNGDSLAVRTDSILSAKPRDDLPIGKAIGQWDLQDKGQAIVFGQAGFILNGKPHMDGVQGILTVGNRIVAHATQRPAFDFTGAIGKTSHQWNLEIEKPEHVKAKGGDILVYHSPLAAINKMKRAPMLEPR
jgi:hypothetical protein